MSAMSSEATRGRQILGPVVTRDCEPPHMDAGNPTQVLSYSGPLHQ